MFIARQLDKFIEENNAIESEQFSLRKGLSVFHQVYRLVEHVTTSLTRKQYTAAIFLDIEEPFDKVWIFSFIYKLIELYHFPPSLSKLIFCYLKDRNFHVKIKNSVSQQFFADFGVPQGAKLSPKLFNLFINDIPHYLHTYLAIFADVFFGQ